MSNQDPDRLDDTRPFPIQGGARSNSPRTNDKRSTIPWWLAEEAYRCYTELYGRSQTLERLAERGGFGREELLFLLRSWMDPKSSQRGWMADRGEPGNDPIDE